MTLNMRFNKVPTIILNYAQHFGLMLLAKFRTPFLIRFGPTCQKCHYSELETSFFCRIISTFTFWRLIGEVCIYAALQQSQIAEPVYNAVIVIYCIPLRTTIRIRIWMLRIPMFY